MKTRDLHNSIQTTKGRSAWRAVILLLAFIIGMVSLPEKASAEPVDRILSFSLQSVSTESMTFRLYSVGIVGDGVFTLDEGYRDSQVDIRRDMDQDAWVSAADTLYQYIKQNLPDAAYVTGNPDQNGEMTFALEPGILYLIASDDEVSDGDTTYRALPMLLWQIEGDTQIIAIKPAEEKSPVKRYTLVKHWAGDKAADRPASVEVELYENDVPAQVVTLSRDNNWTYTWEDQDGEGRWTCLERVPDGYTVKITARENGAKLIVTNTGKEKKLDPKKKKKTKKPGRRTGGGARTGDPTAWTICFIAMLLSGLVLIVTAIRRRRRA